MKPSQTDLELQLRTLLISLGIYGLVSILFYLYAYTQTGYRQSWIAAAIIGVSLIALRAILSLIKRRKFLLAGILVLAAVFVEVGSSELVWIGLTQYNLIGGSLLILLAGLLALPKNRLIVVIGLALYGGYLYAANLLPLPRENVSSSLLLNAFALISSVSLGLALFIQVMTGSQRSSLRTRLVLTYLVLVLLPVAATAGISSALWARSIQEQVVRHLDSVATLKRSEVDTWLNSLPTSLYVVVTQQQRTQQLWTIETLAREYPSTQTYYIDSYTTMKGTFNQVVERTGVFEEIFLLNLDGTIILSTDEEQEGIHVADQAYFNEGIKGSYISPAAWSPEAGQVTIIVAVPVQNFANQPIALLAGRVDMNNLNNMMVKAAGLGDTGEIYLVSKDRLLLTASRFEGYQRNNSVLSSNGVELSISNLSSGSGFYRGYRNVPVIGVFKWLPELQVVLIAEMEQAEALENMFTTLFANVGMAALSVAMAVVIGLVATQRITRPIDALAATAEQITRGDLSVMARVDQQDEIGALAKSFNSMTAQLRSMIAGLEQRVTERTQEVEQRSLQLRAAAEIARDATGISNLDELLNRAVNLIRDRFGFYHAGIFLVDEKNEYAILQASTGEAGREMLARGHRLRIGETGIVGYVSSAGLPRVTRDVVSDTVHYKNPLLPETRSEVALPLKVGERIIGALDVQSTDVNAFDERSVEVLQIMTDQLAVAIENSRLISRMQSTVHELEAAYGTYTQKTWKEFLEHGNRQRGYRYSGLVVEPLEALAEEGSLGGTMEKPVVRPDNDQNGGSTQGASATLQVPMKLRGEPVGTVFLRFTDNEVDPEMVGLFEEVANRLSLALDNVRLLEESQMRSEQLHLLQEITSVAVSHVKLNELLTSVAEKIHAGFSLDACSVILFDPDRRRGALIADISPSGFPIEVESQKLTIPVEGNDIFQQVISTGKSTQVYNLSSEPGAAPLQELYLPRGTFSLLLVPVASRGEVIGVIGLEVVDPKRHFGEDDLRLADQIGLQVGVAVDVARLFEQTERRAERERLMAEITAKVRASTNIDVILQTAVQELSEALKTSKTKIQLRGGGGGHSS